MVILFISLLIISHDRDDICFFMLVFTRGPSLSPVNPKFNRFFVSFGLFDQRTDF